MAVVGEAVLGVEITTTTMAIALVHMDMEVFVVSLRNLSSTAGRRS
jgi:hypothetical protein